ncbi:MAG: PIN domain-containing protein [Opitutaceae bacterium]|nr:PIN domain-containing protein [Opitutaceae bacterium]
MQTEFAAGSMKLSVMVMAELEFGAEKAKAQPGTTKFVRRVETLRTQLEIEPLGEDFPRSFARVRAHLEAAGRKIGDRDTIIAAHALALGATLVTRNIDEFSRVPGLTVENWETD